MRVMIMASSHDQRAHALDPASSDMCQVHASKAVIVWQGDEDSGPFWEIYSLYNIHDLSFKGIYWAVMPCQIPTALALFFVVAFGSSLDVAAIQQDSPEPLDYNRELVTVGQCFLNLTHFYLMLAWA